jgi:hypothetical protein
MVGEVTLIPKNKNRCALRQPSKCHGNNLFSENWVIIAPPASSDGLFVEEGDDELIHLLRELFMDKMASLRQVLNI